MRKLRLKSIFELPSELKEYNFLNCSFDYNGNPNILLKKGKIKRQYELDSPIIQSDIPFDYLLVIISNGIEIFQLNNVRFNFDYAFKADDNKYLFACSYFSDNEGLDYDKNCKIYNSSSELLNEFCVGCYFNDIQITKNGNLWVAEGDIAIFGNWEPANSGLLCFDLDGNLIYKLDTKDSVYDCDAINATDESVWFYYYNAWKLVQLINNEFNERYKPGISFVEHFALTRGSKWGRLLLIDNGYKNNNIYTLFNIKNGKRKFEKRGRYQFINEENELLKCCRSQGEALCFWHDRKLYYTNIDYVSMEQSYMGDKVLLHYENSLDNKLLNAFLTKVINKKEIEKLISKGANINAINRYGNDLLHEVLSYQDHIGVNLDIMQYLIDLGADINHKNEGFNSLYMACITTNNDLVKLLIKNGADVNCVSTDTPESLLDWAEFDSSYDNDKVYNNKMMEIVKTLRRNGAKRLSELESERK